MTNPASGGQGRSAWDDEDEAGGLYPGDHIYSGPHEAEENLWALRELCIEFELYVEDFRLEDRMGAKSAARWEQDSPFSETRSREIANGAVRE